MYSGILQDLGLTANEAKIYQTLLQIGELSIGEIGIKSKIHRRNVYDTIDRLIEKGLIFQIIAKGENIYKAVNPAKLLEIIKEKEGKLNRILPELQQQFKAQPNSYEMYVYKGVDGFKSYLKDILRLKQDVFFIGDKGFWLDPKLKNLLKNFFIESNYLGISYKYIFDIEVKEQLSGTLHNIAFPYKFLSKEYSSKASCSVYGDHVATFTGIDTGKLTEDITIHVLVNQISADSYRDWFRFMWDKS